MKLLLLAGLALAAPGIAFAQSVDDVRKALASPEPGAWAVDWEIVLEPAFKADGEDILSLERSDIESEGEYSFGFTLNRAFSDRTKLSFSPSVTASPHWFDESEASSAASLGAKLQHRFDRSRSDGRPADNLLLFAEYEAGWAWDRFFDDEDAEDHTFTAGVTATDIRAWLCGGQQSVRDRNCTGEDGLAWAYTGSYSVVASSKDDNEYEGPRLAVGIGSPIGASSSIAVELSAERRNYRSLVGDSGAESAEADRYTMTVGLDISDFAKRHVAALEAFKVEIGVRWVTVDANRDLLDRSDVTVIPTFTREW